MRVIRVRDYRYSTGHAASNVPRRPAVFAPLTHPREVDVGGEGHRFVALFIGREPADGRESGVVSRCCEHMVHRDVFAARKGEESLRLRIGTARIADDEMRPSVDMFAKVRGVVQPKLFVRKIEVARDENGGHDVNTRGAGFVFTAKS